MRKSLFFSIMVLAFAGWAPSVRAQIFPWYPSDALVVQQGLIQFNSCVTGLPGCYSRYYRGYRGYYHKPPTKKERVLRVLGAAAAGGGYGYSVTGTGEGALRGAGFGGAAGFTGEVVESYFGERAPAPRGRQVVVYEQRRVEAGPVRPTRYEFRLRNESRFYREVYDGDDYIARMAPGEIWSVPLPGVRYQSWPVKPADGGGWTYGDRELPAATETGWVFRSP